MECVQISFSIFDDIFTHQIYRNVLLQKVGNRNSDGK